MAHSQEMIDAALGDRRHALWFFIVAFVVLAAGYGLRDPWPADEPRFVLIARQMFESGDWLFPHRGIELYPDKPPFYFWLLAACHGLIGSWRWSFLLPSLLAGMGTLWLTLDLGRRLWNPRVGLWAAIAVLASVQFVYQFKRAQIDPTLVFFTTLSLYGLCRHFLLGPHWRWYWLGCFAAGLGVITKGVGFLPLLALLPFAGMSSRNWNGMVRFDRGNALRWGLGALVFSLAIALWLVPLLMAALGSGKPEHAAYLQDILFTQTAVRYANPWHHLEPYWYFIEVIGLFWLPFSLSFPWLWKPWAMAWRERDARVWLPLSWALLVLVLFSCSAGKRDMYILPALPAFALAAAPSLQAISERSGFRRVLWAFLLLLGMVLAGWGWKELLSPTEFATTLAVQRGIGGEARWFWGMFAVIGSAILLVGSWRGPRGVLGTCAFSLALIWCGYGFVVHPVLDASSSARGLMQQARARAGSGTEIGLVAWKEQNLLQSVGPTVEFGYRQPVATQMALATAWLKAAPGQRLLMVQRGNAGLSCVDFDAKGAVQLSWANRRDWWLLSGKAVARCAVIR